MQPLWYRNAVIYQVDVATFQDSDGDGWGDLRGVTERLDYVRGLGATAMWLLPFYETPYRDGGYDVTDHLSVDPRFGDPADIAELLGKAETMGVRVLVELVMQHTSDQHRWFQEARHDRRSRYRDYYVWADEPHDTEVHPIFPTVEDSVWAWDEEAQQFYRHVFYSHEPDLNLANPHVREEMRRIMTYWLRLGVSGFRVDAVPYMVERARVADPTDGGQWLVRQMRDTAALLNPEAVLLGEVDVPPDQYAEYFGGGRGMTLLLDFWVNNHQFLALAREDAEPMRRAIREQPAPPERSQYAVWLRNHDELDLERLTDEERAEVMGAFAPEEDMRAYGRGIRRRLAPMLNGDERRIAMTHALLQSLPGTPVIRYGDEIGMGDLLSEPQRQAVRTPMQWADSAGGGFSTAPPENFAHPLITDGPFAHDRVNVLEQTIRRDSLLAMVSAMIRARLGLQEIGHGECEVLEAGASSVLALRHVHQGRSVLTLVNVAAEDVKARIDLGEDISDLVDLHSDSDYPAPDGQPTMFELRGYGYRFLRPRSELVRLKQ